MEDAGIVDTHVLPVLHADVDWPAVSRSGSLLARWQTHALDGGPHVRLYDLVNEGFRRLLIRPLIGCLRPMPQQFSSELCLHTNMRRAYFCSHTM
jgi:hypothetical protein